MKRFYKVVTTSQTPNGFEIHLDGRPVKTESKRVLCTENENIATHIMREWAEQEEVIIPDRMPLTQILNTRIDRVSNVQERDGMSKAVLKYIDTDLICYLAADPPELFEAQEKIWAPVRTFLTEKFGCDLQVTETIAAIKQDEALHEIMRDYVQGLNDELFTLLQLVTSVSGSLFLAVAFVEKNITSDELYRACYIEEDFKDALYNIDKYGRDPALEEKQDAVKRDMDAAALYLSCL